MRHKTIRLALFAAVMLIILTTGISIRITRDCSCKDQQQATGSDTITCLIKLNNHL